MQVELCTSKHHSRDGIDLNNKVGKDITVPNCAHTAVSKIYEYNAFSTAQHDNNGRRQ